MKVLLIDPGPPRDELDEPLGIEVIAGAIRKEFASVVVVDLASLQFDTELLSTHSVYKDYQLVGIATKLGSFKKIKRTTELIGRLRDKQRPVVIFGDLLATFAYQQLLDVYKDGICVRGEGEDAMCGILKVALDFPAGSIGEIKEEAYRRNLPNLAFKHRGQLAETTRRVVDLSKSVGPARDLLPRIVERKGIVLIEASRGCPWGRCSFCAITAKYNYRGWRPFPVDTVISELEILSSTGVRNPYFTDEDFIGSDPDRVIEIAERILLAKHQGKIHWDLTFYVNMPINAIVSIGSEEPTRNTDMLTRLKEAGMREVFIGLESGSAEQMCRYEKRATVRKNIEAMNLLKNLGLEVDLGFMMFDPEMTFADLKENVNFIRRAGLIDHDAREIKAVRVEPETELAKRLTSKGIARNGYDTDSLTHPYTFADPLVQEVFNLFKEWEKPTFELVWSIQGHSRGEISSEQRGKLKRLLGRFRRLDFEVLCALITVASVSLCDLCTNARTVMQPFSKRRDDLILEWKTAYPEHYQRYLSFRSNDAKW